MLVRVRADRQRTFFTLVELLVVIAIITILAAFLLPALQHSVFRARLIACTNSQKQIVLGFSTYAAENRGRLPARGGNVKDGIPYPNLLKSDYSKMTFDDRTDLAAVYDLNALQCPFHPRQDYVESTADHVFSTYRMFHNWELTVEGVTRPSPVKGMARLGGRMVYGAESFDILVADNDLIKPASPWTRNSHPDMSLGLMRRITHNGPADGKAATQSLYQVGGTLERGPVDNIFGRGDGSVFTITNILPNDTRLELIPGQSSKDGLSRYKALLPSVEFQR